MTIHVERYHLCVRCGGKQTLVDKQEDKLVLSFHGSVLGQYVMESKTHVCSSCSTSFMKWMKGEEGK